MPQVRYSSVQSLSHVWLFATSWTAARQASLSITSSWSLLKLRSIKSVMPSNHLIFCCPFLLLPSIFPSIRVFSNESALRVWWPKYWSFSFSISPSNECSQLSSNIPRQEYIDWSSWGAVLGILDIPKMCWNPMKIFQSRSNMVCFFPELTCFPCEGFAEGERYWGGFLPGVREYHLTELANSDCSAPQLIRKGHKV